LTIPFKMTHEIDLIMDELEEQEIEEDEDLEEE